MRRSRQLRRMLQLPPAKYCETTRTFKPHPTAVQARARHPIINDEEDLDAPFGADVETVGEAHDDSSDPGSESESESNSDSDDGATGVNECVGSVFTSFRGQVQFVSLVFACGSWPDFAARAVTATAAWMTHKTFKLRGEGGLRARHRLQSFAYVQQGALIDGVDHDTQDARGVVEYVNGLLRGGPYSADLSRCAMALSADCLLKLDANRCSFDCDGDLVDAIARFDKALFGEVVESGNDAFTAERVLLMFSCAALGCGELRSVTLAVAEKLVNEQCDWGAGLRAILNARVFEKMPQIVCSVAFDGVLDKLVEGLVSAPAAQQPIYARAITDLLAAAPLDDMYDHKTARQSRDNQQPALSAFRQQKGPILAALRGRRKLICVAAPLPHDAACTPRKALAFELVESDVVVSKSIIYNGAINSALSETMCLLHAVVGHSLQSGSYDGALELEETCFVPGKSFGRGGASDVLRSACGWCNEDGWILAVGAGWEMTCYVEGDRDTVFPYMRCGTTHRACFGAADERPSYNLPLTADGIDALRGEANRCVRLEATESHAAFLAVDKKLKAVHAGLSAS